LINCHSSGSREKTVLQLRKRLYEILEGYDESLVGHLVNGLIIGLILLNIVVIMLESVETLERRYSELFWVIEIGSVAFFTFEYLVRLWVIVEDPQFAKPLTGRLRYMVTFRALIDLLAVLPSYVGTFAEFDARLLRLLRLLRMLKLTRYSHSMDMLVSVFRREYASILSATFVMIVVILVAAGGIYYLERDIQPDHFGSIPQAIWWAAVTLTTVGYGDVVPVTGLGKAFGLVITIAGVGMAALPAGILASGFTREIERRRELYELRVRQVLEDGHLSLREARHLRKLGRQLGLDDTQARLVLEREKEEVLRCPHCGGDVPATQPKKKVAAKTYKSNRSARKHGF